ncbi:hypothetical protein [Sphingomonas sp. NIBR02145]|uniref:hypothetical protein n=1 Tax=Sphingomonas sp. NIBR02145 TaxID=3014784 RepID=UPI0022B461FD|nr:hypothetical protein [Sphingomonas sp. NIBR02145]WHU01287.1 hypothetical protein O3305_13865 [Sphingomonas sp. NIBR02145]
MKLAALCLGVLAASSGGASAQSRERAATSARSMSLDRAEITAVGVDASRVRYRGARALRLEVVRAGATSDATFARLDGVQARDFTIDLVLAGQPVKNDTDARGFVGIAFRISEDSKKFEAIYIRPTNGRATDQLRRNHSTQYISHPDYPWHRLRKEHPGQYESYADLESGAWTRLKLVVRGTTAQLYINGAGQPSLIVNDLKLPAEEGGIGLWVGPGSEGYFKSMTIRKRQP